MDNPKLHTMESTNKTITIIGLCFEAISLLFLWALVYLFLNFEELLPFSSSWEISYIEYLDVIEFFDSFGMIFIIISAVFSIFILFNIVVFTKLIRGKFKEKTAKGFYLYQAIYGGLSLSSNQIVGILYLVSGIRGYKGEQEVKDIRTGI